MQKDLTEERTLKYASALDEKILPTMKGDLGIWDKSTPATTRGKRNLLYIIAERQALLDKQKEWIVERQEYYRRLRGEA